MNRRLELDDTVPAGLLFHRLALGLEFIDAGRQAGAFGPLCVDVESIGKRTYPRVIGSSRLPMRFDIHRADRHSMRYSGRTKRLVDAMVRDLAANAGAEKGWVVRAYAPRNPLRDHYDPDGDARIYVPRRLRFELVLLSGMPTAGVQNMRRPWLWPGSAYPVTETSTTVRGRVLKGASVDTAKPVRWTRVFLAAQAANVALSPANIVGCGHGDDRGDFVISLERSAQTSGATLPAALKVSLWAFAPPVVPLNADDPLSDLPVENMGALPTAAALRGDRVPPGYARFDSKDITVPLGSVLSDPLVTTLLKP